MPFRRRKPTVKSISEFPTPMGNSIKLRPRAKRSYSLFQWAFPFFGQLDGSF
jgi:hypothetical protein